MSTVRRVRATGAAGRMIAVSCVAAAAVLLYLGAGITAAPQQAAAPPAPAGQTPQAPVFRGGVNFVSVDAFPRRDGHIVEGLNKGDFQILEDGKPQAVETFEFIHVAPSPVDSERRDPNNAADADRQAADPHNRVFVVYLDLAHTTLVGSHDARQPVVDFLTRTIGPTDLFGVLTAEIPVGQMVFGRRTEAIESQLATYWTWGQADRSIVAPRTPYETQLQQCGMQMNAVGGIETRLIKMSREDALMTSLENLVVRLRELRDERKNILFISEGWVPLKPQTDLVASGTGAVPTPGIGLPGTGIRQQGANDRSWCDTQVARLANIDFEQRFRTLLTSANRANVSFYPIDVGGLGGSAGAGADVGTPNQKPSGGGGRIDTLRSLAESTDGFATVNTNDLSSGIKRVTDDLSSYYLLGYYSTNSSRDGRFRRIEVKVNQPRVTMSARRGYFGPTAEMAAAAAAAVPGVEAVDAELARLGHLRPDAEVFSYGVPTQAGLDVVVELASSQTSRGRWSSGADVRVVASAAGGADITGTARIEGGTRGVIVSLPVDAARRGPWQVTTTVSGDGDRVQDQTQVAVPAALLVGQPIAYRATPSPRSPLRPIGDFQLSRSERLHVEWPLLQDLSARTARLLDRKGQPLGSELPFATPPADRHVLAIDLPMASLPEGDFVVELTAASGAGVSERRLLAFRVVR